MPPDLDNIRREMAGHAKSSRTRAIHFRNHWQPHDVTSPQTGTAFTDAEAWEFVANLLESNVALRPVELKTAAGKLAYEMQVDLPTGSLYVKLELGSGAVLGRSFHYSIYR